MYHQGLRDEIKEVIAQIDPQPQTCEDLIALSLRLDHRLSNRKGDRKKSEPCFLTRPKDKTDTDPKDVGEPMDIVGERGPLSAEGKEQRRKNGQCLYCSK